MPMRNEDFMTDNDFSIYGETGFGLVELMIASLILTCSLLAVGPLLSTTIRLTATARSKSTAAVAAQSTLEHLADLYRRNPSDAELAPGQHQEESLREVRNPLDSGVLDRYEITWVVGELPDPRPSTVAAVLPGRTVSVRVTPVGPDDEPILGKSLTVNTMLGMEP
jgi:type II secretory pathway pseudopilin PulG